MDKNALKKYAVWARRELISRVSQKALQYGISETECGNAGVDSVNGRVLNPAEKVQRDSLIAKIQKDGYTEAMEEAAYTWFNRFTALRYMEVNGYLPSHVRVFTDEKNRFNPQIIAEAIHLDIEGLDMDKVYAYKKANNTEELYKYLLITQCNDFGNSLPGMFSNLSDYTILLFPDNILREGSVLEQLISVIPEEDWKDQVQIIGWLYQYYISEKKDAVFAAMKNNVKVSKENIPAATQLFTPDWIVRYMVENSLGRLWIEHLQANRGISFPISFPMSSEDTQPIIDRLKQEWKYYLDEAEQTSEVQAQLAEIREGRKQLTPEQIRFIDPCMGSGHILVYAFDVLMQIYLSCGYTERDAAQNIVRYNLWGLDLDKRAYQLAYFAVMMKARKYDRRFLTREIKPNLSYFQDLPKPNYDLLDEPIRSFVQQFENADTYGSLMTPEADDSIDTALDNYSQRILIGNEEQIEHLMMLNKNLSQKYDVVCTNPPYMGNSNMNVTLADYLKKMYPDSKSDLSTAFMEKCEYFTAQSGYYSMINIPVWMFLSSYETLRKNIVSKNTYSSMIHLGRGIFGSDFGTTSFVISKQIIPNYLAVYRRLFEKQGAVDSIEQKEKWFIEGMGYHNAYQENFSKIPGSPIAYWVSNNFIKAFEIGNELRNFTRIPKGLSTGSVDTFMRLWYEVSFKKIDFESHSCEQSEERGYKWFPYAKGGAFRRWNGNLEYIVNWENNGFEVKHFVDEKGKQRSRPQNTAYYFKKCLTYSAITSYKYSLRCLDKCIFGGGGDSIHTIDDSMYSIVLALMNTNLAQYYLSVISPTINFEVDHIKRVPLIIDKTKTSLINDIVNENITLSKNDWDSFETSWGFKIHPFIIFKLQGAYQWGDKQPQCRIQKAYEIWADYSQNRFNKLKANEEELNRIFIEIYGLRDELTPEVEDKDVTVRTADLQRDVKSFISYAVGCMFGRYSIDVPGLMYAGGNFDTKYCRWIRQFGENADQEIDENGELIHGGWAGCSLWEYDGVRKDGHWVKASYAPDTDGIIPICDDAYFDDDITGLFIQFVKTVFGENTLEENLKFIADALGGKGNPRTVIRNYFLNSFFADHCKTYQKRPIYWLFDSGKKNGFKALIYMHRYQPDTIARMRTDYVHEQQSRYRTAIADLERRISEASGSEAVKLKKQLEKINDQADELLAYEEKIHHIADQMIMIDLDDGVKHNYEIFKDVLAKIK